MRTVIKFLCASALFVAAYAQTGYAAYMHGHVDDWILFRGEQAYKDGSNTNNRVLIVTATAGDNGAANSIGYWQSREAGMMAAVQQMVGSSVTCTTDSPSHNGHTIYRSKCNNVWVYFMRLPDGNHNNPDYNCGGTGYGFPSTGCNSLLKLKNGLINSLTAVDSSTTYNGWSDFVNTLEDIMNDDKPTGVSTIWINAPDYDSSDNPVDHPDHTAVSIAVDTFAPGSFNQYEYLTYCTNVSVANGGCLKSDNLFAPTVTPKKAMHDAYRTTTYQVLHNTYGQWNYANWANTTYTADWVAWGQKTYGRQITA